MTGREGREQGAGALMGLGRNQGGGVGKERLAGGGVGGNVEGEMGGVGIRAPGVGGGHPRQGGVWGARRSRSQLKEPFILRYLNFPPGIPNHRVLEVFQLT